MSYSVRIRKSTNEKWEKHDSVSLSLLNNLIKDHLEKNDILRIVIKENK